MNLHSFGTLFTRDSFGCIHKQRDLYFFYGRPIFFITKQEEELVLLLYACYRLNVVVLA